MAAVGIRCGKGLRVGGAGSHEGRRDHLESRGRPSPGPSSKADETLYLDTRALVKLYVNEKRFGGGAAGDSKLERAALREGIEPLRPGGD